MIEKVCQSASRLTSFLRALPCFSLASLVVVSNRLDNSRKALQGRSRRVNAIGHAGDGVTEHAGRVSLRDCGGFEAPRDGMPEGMKAKPIPLQAELDELLAKKLAKAGADLVAFAGAARQARKQLAVLRQCLGVLEQAGVDDFAVQRYGASARLVFKVVGAVAIVNVEHDHRSAVRASCLNVGNGKLCDFFEAHPGIGADQRRPRQRGFWRVLG